MAEPRGKALREGEEPPGGAVAASEAWRKGEEEAAETEGGKEEGMSVWWDIEWLPKSVGSTKGETRRFRARPPPVSAISHRPRLLPQDPHCPLALSPSAISYGFLRVILFSPHLAI